MTEQTPTPDEKAPEAPEQTQDAPVADEQPSTDLGARRDEQKAQEAENGVLHDTALLDQGADGYVGAPTMADQEKPSKAPGYEAPDGTELAKGPATMADQKKPSLSGKDYQRGYVGEVESTEDLTLPAVLKRDYPEEN